MSAQITLLSRSIRTIMAHKRFFPGMSSDVHYELWFTYGLITTGWTMEFLSCVTLWMWSWSPTRGPKGCHQDTRGVCRSHSPFMEPATGGFWQVHSLEEKRKISWEFNLWHCWNSSIHHLVFLNATKSKVCFCVCTSLGMFTFHNLIAFIQYPTEMLCNYWCSWSAWRVFMCVIRLLLWAHL